MGKCRIQNIIPPCDYRLEGIDLIRLLDFDDFFGFKFDGDDLYSNCMVTAVLRSGDFVPVDTPDTAKYSSTLQNGIYTHTLETFIGDLSAELEATLHLAIKRRYIVLFRAKSGRFFAFGYDAGATVSYANQTAEGAGSLLTITATSAYPLFEATKEAATRPAYNVAYAPVETSAFCTIDDENENTGVLQYAYMAKVSSVDGQPLDLDGLPCAVSGGKQALYKLEGFPDMAGYDTEGEYADEEPVKGEPSAVYNLEICPLPSERVPVVLGFNIQYFK